MLPSNQSQAHGLYLLQQVLLLDPRKDCIFLLNTAPSDAAMLDPMSMSMVLAMLSVRASILVAAGSNAGLECTHYSSRLSITHRDPDTDVVEPVKIDRHRGTKPLAVFTVTTLCALEALHVRGWGRLLLVWVLHFLEDGGGRVDLGLLGEVQHRVLTQHRGCLFKNRLRRLEHRFRKRVPLDVR
jgi:hypothetical protein